MIETKELKKEQKYLNRVIDTIEEGLTSLNNALYSCEKDLKSVSEYLSDTYYEIDVEERAQQRLMFEKMQLDVVALADRKTLLEHQKKSAYFGRVDFKEKSERKTETFYIGIANLSSKISPVPLVLDWRAPLSSIYYDYECGKVEYSVLYADELIKIQGNMKLKRQFKTQQRDLIYAFDSNLTIGDEILKEALAGNANTKMKTIVSTIQSEQNKIIRADESTNLLVQGVAGSGKTSIALHRVAYLLYKNKISAKDILIISPSSLFSDYISNVLPELGEHNSPKTTFDEIAHKELLGFVHFEPKSQMLEDILNGNTNRAKEVEYKASFEFYEKLKDYLNTLANVSFKAKDIKLGKQKISAEIIQKLYDVHYKSHSPNVRIEWIADYIIDVINIPKQSVKSVFERLKRMLFAMFLDSDILSIYRTFLSQNNMEFNSVQIKQNMFVGYEDVPAILYIKNFLLGVEIQKNYKHIIIDEMQDYSPIVFDLFNTIFTATKTILGDINQTFEKNLNQDYLTKLSKLIGNTKLIKLKTSYRSTVQIATYCQKLLGLENVKNFKREGQEVCEIKNTKTLITKLEKILKEYEQKYETIAVLTTDIATNQKIYDELSNKINISLIDEKTSSSASKISIMPTVFSKGLEFDAVIYINTDTKAPKYIQNNIKYIACTRALHELVVVK